MKDSFRKTARLIIFLATGVLLLWISFRGTDMKKLGEMLLQAHYWWLLASAAISVFAFLVRAWRWKLLIEPLGYSPGNTHTYHSVVTGYFANLIFPRLGEVTRCAALSRKEKIPFDRLVGTVIIERTIDFLTVFVLLGLTLLAGSTTTGNFLSVNVVEPLNAKVSSLPGSPAMFYATLALLAALAVWLYFALRKSLSRLTLFRKLYTFSDGIIAGLKSIAGLRKRWEFIGLTTLLWVCYFFMAWIPMFCFDSSAGLGPGAAMFVLVVGSFGMAAPVQSGLGAYHWIVSRGLLAAYSLPLEEGLAYATLSHESQLLVIAVAGAISLYSLFGRKSGSVFRAAEEGAGA